MILLFLTKKLSRRKLLQFKTKHGSIPQNSMELIVIFTNSTGQKGLLSEFQI